VNSHQITAFHGIQLNECSCHLYCNNALLCQRCVPNRGHNITTKFGDNRSKGKEINVFIESQDGGDHHAELWLVLAFSTTCRPMYSVSSGNIPKIF